MVKYKYLKFHQPPGAAGCAACPRCVPIITEKVKWNHRRFIREDAESSTGEGQRVDPQDVTRFMAQYLPIGMFLLIHDEQTANNNPSPVSNVGFHLSISGGKTGGWDARDITKITSVVWNLLEEEVKSQTCHQETSGKKSSVLNTSVHLS